MKTDLTYMQIFELVLAVEKELHKPRGWTLLIIRSPEFEYVFRTYAKCGVRSFFVGNINVYSLHYNLSEGGTRRGAIIEAISLVKEKINVIPWLPV